MLKNMLFAAMCVFCSVVAIVIAILGGCGSSRRVIFERGISASASTPTPQAENTANIKGIREISDNAASVGRLEQPALVTATVFHAEGGQDNDILVDLAPGVWLVPARVFEQPDNTGSVQ